MTTIQIRHWFLVPVFQAWWFLTFLELLNSFEWLMKAMVSFPIKMHRQTILHIMGRGVAVNPWLQVKKLCTCSLVGVLPSPSILSLYSNERVIL